MCAILCGKKSLTAGGQVPLTDQMGGHGSIGPPGSAGWHGKAQLGPG